jgi:hypothetical protein
MYLVVCAYQQFQQARRNGYVEHFMPLCQPNDPEQLLPAREYAD